LEAIKAKKNIAVLVKHGVLSEKEVNSRYEINVHAYNTVVSLEGSCAATIARTQLIPAALEFQSQLSSVKSVAQKKLLKTVSGLIDKSLVACDALEASLAKHDSAKTVAGMLKLRESIDALEAVVPANTWPLPSYAEMLLMNA